MAEWKLSQVAKWDHEFVWHPFTQMQDWLAQEPVVIERGEGVYLIDENGKKYYDGVSSLWVNIHGHNHPTLNAALKEQVDKIAHSTLLGLVSPPSAQLCKELVELAPEGLNKVFLSDDGSTAIEIAIKMAYQYRQQVGQTEKTKFISLNAGYHGDTLGTVSVGGIQLFHQVFHNLLFKPITLPSPGVYRDVADREASFEESLAELERILDEEGHQITALVMEPLVQAAAGMLVMPHGYLKRVRELTAAHDVFLIVDEVATGFGRTGTFFACEQEGVSPDFMTLSKGITGGYMPLAATLTTQRVFDAFLGTFEEKKTFYHGHSYTGNALACAVALASLQVFRDEKVMEGLPRKIEA
ncbi:MAG: adenosylmethionine--8-amino-7-oxononanoate transaminase, partial [Veillonella caviae]|nr:adenosylmethionine--8-amino-7-oxononanoate transaminase [Veillonella caviae]